MLNFSLFFVLSEGQVKLLTNQTICSILLSIVPQDKVSSGENGWVKAGVSAEQVRHD